MSLRVGIDIGSTCAKTVVLDAEKRILERILLPTGWSSVDTAEGIRAELEAAGAEYCGGSFHQQVLVVLRLYDLL